MDILSITSGVIIQQVNTLGVMGAGLAEQIARKYPKVLQSYKDNYKMYSLGDMQFVSVGDLFVVNLYAQSSIGRTGLHTDYSAFFSSLEKAAYTFTGYKTYIPYGIGCGLGGGDWNIIKSIIHYLYPSAWIVSRDWNKPVRISSRNV